MSWFFPLYFIQNENKPENEESTEQIIQQMVTITMSVGMSEKKNEASVWRSDYVDQSNRNELIIAFGSFINETVVHVFSIVKLRRHTTKKQNRYEKWLLFCRQKKGDIEMIIPDVHTSRSKWTHAIYNLLIKCRLW